jgi:hypothetical protein
VNAFNNGNGNGAGVTISTAVGDSSGVGSSEMVSLNGRMDAVQNEIKAIKTKIMAAQVQAGVHPIKQVTSNVVTGESSRQTPPSMMLLTAAPRSSQVVLGLSAEIGTNLEDFHAVSAAEIESHGTELKKRKRAQPAETKEAAAPVVEEISAESAFALTAAGDVGNTYVGNDVSDGGDIVMSINNNPLYVDVDNSDVTAGPDSQACRGK